MTTRRGALLAGLGLAGLLVLGRVTASAYAEWSWFAALDASDVWRARFLSLTALRGGMFVVAFLFAFANFQGMRRSIVSLVLPRRVGNIEIGEAIPGLALTLVATVLSVAIAIAFSLPQDDWRVLLRAWWSSPVGESDPYLSLDFSFWTDWLPFERLLHEWVTSLAVVVGAGVMALYGLTPSVRVERGHVHLTGWVRRHFAIFSALLLLVLAWGYRLDAFAVYVRGSGPNDVSNAFDHRVLYPYLVSIGFFTAAVALFVAWAGWTGRQRATITALVVVLVAGPVGRLLLPVLDRRAMTEPERTRLERPYSRVRELYVRRAFRVDDIRRGPAADSVRVAEPARSASAWDPAAAQQALAEEGSSPISVSGLAWRSAADSSLRMDLLVGRAGGGSGGTARAARVSSEAAFTDHAGGPRIALDVATELPAVIVAPGWRGSRVVDDSLNRLAAPAFGRGWPRVALAWGERQLRLLAVDVDSAHGKLLMRRDVRARVAALFPYFAVGPTVQPVVVADSLWWTVELFVASNDQPLTEGIEFGGTTVRAASLAARAVVNAHTGRVRAILPRRPDAVTRHWVQRLPSLFVSSVGVSAALMQALPPAVDELHLQGAALARTGFRNDTLSARPLLADADADLDFYGDAPTLYVAGGGTSALAWAVPVVDATDRMRGALVSLGGARPRSLFVEQADSTRWTAMLDRLQRVADSAGFSRDLRHPRRGRVRLIPATDGLWLAQSFYDWPTDRPPQLSGVVAIDPAGRRRTGRSLAEAFGADRGPEGPETALRADVARAYVAMREALQRGDWAAFGRAMDALGRLSRQK